MCAKSRKTGRFVPEDFVPELEAERYLNEKFVEVEFGADASVAASASFDTGMGAEEGPRGDETELQGFKWVVYGAYLIPYHTDTPTDCLSHAFTGQLRYGQQAAMINRYDGSVIGQFNDAHVFTTSGMRQYRYPIAFDIKFPKPVFSPQLSFILQAIDHAAYNSKIFICSVVYGWARATSRDIWAELQAGHT